MIVNIAFNTIIYIMVFLFPGVIFRRTYFTGEIRNKFDSGSNFERILWAILLSFISITSFCLFAGFIDTYTNNFISHTANISEREILCVFEDIYSNHYPDALRSKEGLLKVAVLLLILYTFSAFLGSIIHRIVYSTKLDRYISFLKFGNHWEYYFESNKNTNIYHRFGDVTVTQLDLKTENDLFTGLYNSLIVNDENSVESIVLEEAYKYFKLKRPDDDVRIEEIKEEIAAISTNKIEHLDTPTSYVYKKRIAGNVFVLNKADIKDISVRYIKVRNVIDKWFAYGKSAFSLFSIAIMLVCLINILWDMGFYPFENDIKRSIFSITLIINLYFLVNIVLKLLVPKEDRKYSRSGRIQSLIYFIYFLIPHLYSFSLIEFSTLIIIMVVLLPFISLALLFLDKSKN